MIKCADCDKIMCLNKGKEKPFCKDRYKPHWRSHQKKGSATRKSQYIKETIQRIGSGKRNLSDYDFGTSIDDMISALKLNNIKIDDDNIADLCFGREKAFSYMAEVCDQLKFYIKGTCKVLMRVRFSVLYLKSVEP